MILSLDSYIQGCGGHQVMKRVPVLEEIAMATITRWRIPP